AQSSAKMASNKSKTPTPSPSRKPEPAAAAPVAKASKPALNASDLKRMILERKSAPRAIAFTLDEVQEIAKRNEQQLESLAKTSKVATVKTTKTIAPEKLEKPAKPNHIKAASLADILG